MCGFTGVVALHEHRFTEADHLRIQQLSEKLVHRGPDAHQHYFHPQFCTAHRRLAIIDTDARSVQPFHDAEQRYTLVFNGEIYNYAALRSKLEAQGVTFKTASDTEVLFELLILKGKEALHELNGCFAFAFYDAQTNNTLLVRDRMGINPLWYRIEQNQLSFASERKALHYSTPAVLSERALAYFMRFSYVPAPLSIHRDTFKLPPGHLLEIRDGVVGKAERWYDPTHSTEGATDTAAIRETLAEAVSDRLVADVPVGCFLSGGIDSSIVTALAAEHHPKIETFSIGFEEQPHLDESQYALQAAKHLGTDHHHFQLSAKALDASVNTFFKALDEPFADSSSIAVDFLSEETRKHVTVALSGDGADELFGGYRKHRAHALAQHWPSAAFAAPALFSKLFAGSFSRESAFGDKMRQMNRLAEGARMTPEARYNAWAAFIDNATLAGLMPSTQLADLPFAEPENDRLNGVLFSDQLHVLPNDMLTKVDLMSMQHSLEVRTPFLDHRVVELANRMASVDKFDRRTGKKPLRAAFADRFPDNFFERPKKGFEVPLESLMHGPLFNRVRALANSKHLAASPIDTGRIQALLDRWASGQSQHTQVLWHLLVLHSWLEENN